MSAGSGSRPSRRRPALTAAAGVLAGVCGVVVIRAVFGPRTVLAGSVAGTAALVAGVSLSWGVSRPGRRRRRDDRPPRWRTRPVNWLAPVFGSVLAMLAWAGVAHSSGSGWVQAVGALLAAVLITGLLAPYVAARRARVTCTASPSDSEAGYPVELAMTANGPVRIRPRRPTGSVARAVGPSHGYRAVTVEVTPERRGVLPAVTVEVASCAPFGLLWWAKEVVVTLPRPLHVAPRTGDPGAVDSVPRGTAGEAARRLPAGHGEPRGIRPYRPGDSRRSVHWPATSHTGTLMTRDREAQTDEPVVIEVVLPPDPATAESVAEQVMGAVSVHLAGGRHVILVTAEAGGRTMRPVLDRVDLGRRLARAVPTPLTGDPRTGEGWPGVRSDGRPGGRTA